MFEYTHSIFMNVDSKSKFFVFIPSHFSIALFAKQYDLLFKFLHNNICYPVIVYRDWYYAKSIVHKLFDKNAINIIRCNDSLSYHLKKNDYKTAFFCWEYRYISSYIKDNFGFDVPDIRDGGCYLLHIPHNNNPELQIVHRLYWNEIEKILKEI